MFEDRYCFAEIDVDLSSCEFVLDDVPTLPPECVVPRDPLPPFPEAEENTDEVPPYERLMRKHAAPEAPEKSIDEEVDEEGIEDKDPFEAFTEVGDAELKPAVIVGGEELTDDEITPIDGELLVAISTLDEQPSPLKRKP